MSSQHPPSIATASSEMHTVVKTPNVVVRFWSSLSKRLGFRRPLSFFFFFVFGGALAGFSLASFRLLDPTHYYTASFAPGEVYWVREGIRKAGMILHLAAILPCGILSILQFIPKIRKQYILLHRINGYLVLILLVLGITGGFIMARHTFGGGVAASGATYAVGVVTLISALMGYYNIKQIQLEQHRKWMLRMVIYMSSIITARVAMMITAAVVTTMGGFAAPWSCAELLYTLDSNTTKVINAGYPQCTDPNSGDQLVLVPATFEVSPQGVGSALRVAFGNSMWTSLLIHVVLAEIYLKLTPSETDRLRAISYQRQLEAGVKHPGSAGTTSDRWGDAKYYHASQLKP